jgi:lysophospholipase L1-like esterase
MIGAALRLPAEKLNWHGLCLMRVPGKQSGDSQFMTLERRPLFRCAMLAAFVAALALAPSLGRAQDAPGDCTAPTSTMLIGSPLTHTGARLMQGAPVKIVAIGSSSTAGAGATDAAHAYPNQLALALNRRFPRSDVTVLNKGVNGEQTADMLARFDRDVFAEHPDLVVWQTGSNEILKNSNPEAFKRLVGEGLARLQAAGIETILMDAQYAPAVLAKPVYAKINDTLRQLSQNSKVAFFDRFAAMRYWLNSGKQDLAHIVAKDQTHMSDAGYRCVGRTLASLIAADMPPAIATLTGLPAY